MNLPTQTVNNSLQKLNYVKRIKYSVDKQTFNVKNSEQLIQFERVKICVLLRRFEFICHAEHLKTTLHEIHGGLCFRLNDDPGIKLSPKGQCLMFVFCRSLRGSTRVFLQP